MPKRLLEHSSAVSGRDFQALLDHESAGLTNESLTDSELEDYGALECGGMVVGKRLPWRVHLVVARPSPLLPVFHEGRFLLPHPSAFVMPPHSFKSQRP